MIIQNQTFITMKAVKIENIFMHEIESVMIQLGLCG